MRGERVKNATGATSGTNLGEARIRIPTAAALNWQGTGTGVGDATGPAPG